MWVACAIALLAATVYGLTLYPSVGGGGDPIKFQYLGSVLGTAHPPGYPLYVFVSHLFSRLPFGTPAFRINLMSAVFGAVTAALIYLLCRRLDASRAAAAGAALAAAFGRAFWSKSIVAEVYSLNAALFAAILLALVVWEARRGAALYAAVVLFALAIGNHLTIAFTVPALALYAVLVDRRRALAPRTLLTSALIMIAGLAQYLFIILRTRQHVPYLEAQATNLRELVDVIRARRFSYEIATFDAHTLLTERLPRIAASVRDELAWLGVLAAIVGLAVLARRRPRETALFLVAGAGVAAVTMNVDADVEGFLMPALAGLAPFVATGLDTAGRALSRLPGRSREAKAGPVGSPAIVAAAAALLASWNLAANYRVNDHHTRTFEARYIDALFERLPLRAAIVSEDYAADQLVTYELVAEDGARGRDIRLVPRDLPLVYDLRAAGFDIFAWPNARAELESRGFQFVDEPLAGVPLWQHLRELRPGWIAILAAPSGTLREWPPEAADALAMSRDPRDQAWRTAAAAFAFVRGRGTGLHQTGDPRAVIDVSEGGALGQHPSPASIHAEASPEGARIRVSDRDAIATTGEVALVVLTPDGRTAQASRVDPTRHLRVPFDDPAYALSRVTAATACAEIGNRGWQDVTRPFSEGRIRVRVDNFRPFESKLDTYLVASEPLSVGVMNVEGPAPPRFSIRQVDLSALAASLANDGATLSPRLGALVYRLSVAINDLGQEASFVIDTHGRVAHAIARATVDRDPPKRAMVCGVPLGEPLDMGAVIIPDAKRFFGSGWHDVEGEGSDAFRWTAALESELLLPLADARPSRLVVTAMPLPGDRDASIALVVNGEGAAPQPLRPGWHDYVFEVAPTRWLNGMNQVLVRSARLVQPGAADPRQLGLAFRALQLQ